MRTLQTNDRPTRLARPQPKRSSRSERSLWLRAGSEKSSGHRRSPLGSGCDTEQPNGDTTMTDPRMALADLIEKGGDADFLKEVLAFSLQGCRPHLCENIR